jgi:hypothetical protein
MNVRSAHFIVCDTHKVAWCIGSNLFSDWRDEDAAVWEANVAKLEHYAGVEPLPEGVWSIDTAARAAELAEHKRKLWGTLAPSGCALAAGDTPNIPF